MTYAMSDIHGEYQKFLEMLELIEFSDDDTLYILGDIIDRGPEPVKLLKDLMSRSNVFPTMGNHDFFALDVLTKLMEDVTDENACLAPELMNQVLDWIQDGGGVTLRQFQELDSDERVHVLEYIADFPYAEVYETDERSFIMTHAGLGNFQKDKKLSDYSVFDLIAARPDPGQRCFDDESIYVVCGHTPTVNICGEYIIYHSCGNIYIDCGAVFGGKLACLCLDNMKEFYV